MMMTNVEIPPDHPRASSLRTREKLIRYWKDGVVAEAGLIAHGRGEAFDYLIGEETIPPAREATMGGAAQLLLAKKPVISVNGNAAALASRELVNLAEVAGAELEVNLFYRTKERMKATASLLHDAGAKRVLGVGEAHATIPELSSQRRTVDPSGILLADVVFVPLEDGDRVEALRRMGKVTIAVDLNPLSRTSRKASVTIVDNLTRAVPNLASKVEELRRRKRRDLEKIVKSYDNERVLGRSLRLIERRLVRLSREAGRRAGRES